MHGHHGRDQGVPSLIALIEAAMGLPPFPVMVRQDLTALGFEILEPAPRPSLLPLDEWHEDSCIGRKGNLYAVGLVHARKPGTGNWRRLLARLKAIEGARVAVICPIGRFAEHLAREGWRPGLRDGGLEFWSEPQ